MNIQQALARSRPPDPGSAVSHALEAQRLLAEIVGQPRAWILAHPESHLTDEQEASYLQQLFRIQSGTPLAYILGRQEFYGRSFRVSPATLIPRPETELMIEIALPLMRNYPAGHRLIDVGTGSGCIGITLACEDPAVQILAIDASLEALQVARQNAADHLDHDRWAMIQGNLLEAVSAQFMLICANLPYIPSRRLDHLDVSRHEPRLALDGGLDGMRYTQTLISQLRERLHPAGSAILEIDHGQAGSLREIGEAYLPDRTVRLYKDSSGQERVLVIGPEGA